MFTDKTHWNCKHCGNWKWIGKRWFGGSQCEMRVDSTQLCAAKLSLVYVEERVICNLTNTAESAAYCWFNCTRCTKVEENDLSGPDSQCARKSYWFLKSARKCGRFRCLDINLKRIIRRSDLSPCPRLSWYKQVVGDVFVSLINI